MFATSWVRDDRMCQSARRWKLQFLTVFSTCWSKRTVQLHAQIFQFVGQHMDSGL